MRVLAVCGTTNSGKTTTVERIIAELIARGYRVGTIKYIHCPNFRMDTATAEDTYRHRLAGAGLVAAHAEHETSLLFPGRLPTAKLLGFYEGDCDWVVCEGVADIPLPTIITSHNETDLAEKWTSAAFCVSGVIAESGLVTYRGLPVIKDILRLVDLIELEVAHYDSANVHTGGASAHLIL